MDQSFDTTRAESGISPDQLKEENRTTLKKVALFVKENTAKGAVVLVVGAWGVGKTTFGKALSCFTAGRYLDGDNQEWQTIKATLHGDIPIETYTVIGASFAENWASEEDIKLLQQDNRLLVVNIVADDKTRMNNMFMRAQGYKRDSDYDVEQTRGYIQESPNYITPLADVILNFNSDSRPSLEEMTDIFRTELQPLSSET